jgi:ParB family chromosome partitioning protein
MPKRPDIAALAREAFGRKPATVHPLKNTLSDENSGRIVQVAVDRLEANPDQPRKEFSAQAHEELTASIKQVGILQPLIARKNPTDPERCILIAGERRWRAAKAAGLREVPVLIRGPEDALEIAIIENLQRENLSPLEEAEALLKLKETKGYKLEDLARIIGKSKPTVSESLKLLELPEDIRAEVVAGSDVRTYEKSQLLQVVRAGDPEKVRATWDALKAGEAPTVRALRERAKPATGRPKHFSQTYQPEHGRFRVTVTFQKVRVTPQEVKEALREAAREID